MRDELRQPYGILHGGVYSSLVESLCSYATAAAVYEDGNIAMGQAIEVSFLRPVTSGHAEARAVARHRGQHHLGLAGRDPRRRRAPLRRWPR